MNGLMQEGITKNHNRRFLSLPLIRIIMPQTF